jgi:prophage maintenance system killer protein
MFLESNGHTFIASEESVLEKTLALAAREIEEKDYAEWLSQSIE